MRLRITLFLAIVFLGPFAQGFPAYYDISQHVQAQAEARQRNLPLAWLGGYPADLKGFPQNDQAALEQMAMATLQGGAVVVFFDCDNMNPVPPIVHAQFHAPDDGPLPGGANWKVPKIAFTNPEVTEALGRVSATQMTRDGPGSIRAVLQSIRNDPLALAVPTPRPPRSPDASSDTEDTTDFTEPAPKPWTGKGGLIVSAAGLLLWLLWSRRRRS